MSILAAIPVKRFYVAKRRLAPVLDAATRSRLGRALALHTLEVVALAGVDPIVLAADTEVADWAEKLGRPAMVDHGPGLDCAVATASRRAVAEGRPWLIVHADLPLLVSDDIASAVGILESGRPVLAPAEDGGTSLVGGHLAMAGSYGPGSFHRHLARLPDSRVLVRLGLALDLDDPSDLVAARNHPRGKWLDRYPGPT